MKRSFLVAIACLPLCVMAQKPRLVVPIGHTQEVSDALFADDGKSVMTSDIDGKRFKWNLWGRELEHDSGDPLSTFRNAFSPNGKFRLIINAGKDTVKLAEFRSGRELLALYNEHTSRAAFSSDGKMVLTGSTDGWIKRWDLSGRLMSASKIADDHITKMDFSPDGKFVLTTNGKRSANLWDVISGKLLQTFSGHANRVFDVAFSPDGKSLLAGGMQGAKRWNLTGLGYQNVNGYNEGVTKVAFSPDGNTMLLSTREGTTKLCDLSGHILQTISGKKEVRHGIATFSPDGKTLLTNGEDNTIQLWEASTATLLHTFKGHNTEVNAASFSPDGRTLLTESEDGLVKLWDVSGKLLQTFENLGNPVVFSPDGKALITGGEEGLLKLYDLTGRELRDLGPALESCSVCNFKSISFSKDGKSALTSNGFDQSAKLWNVSGGQLRSFGDGSQETDPHNDIVNSAIFSPDGRKVVTGSEDNTLKIWDVASDKALATLIALDSIDWVVTTPSGLFDASPGAMNLMYFVVGKDLDVIELEQLKERYYEPGLLAKVMGFSNEPIREVEGFDSVALYPSIHLQLDTLQNKLHIRLSPRNGGVGKVSMFINDKEIIQDANPLPRAPGKLRDTAITIELDKYARYFLLNTLNTVSIRAYNEAGWLKSAAQSVEYQPVFARSKGGGNVHGSNDDHLLQNRNPSLHILVVGTSDYAGADLDLKYPSKDARDMASALEQIGKQLYIPIGGKVLVHLLTTDSSTTNVLPTKANIKAAFEDIKNNDKAEDVIIVYFSGHGITYGDADRALFYYLTRDIGGFDLSDAGIRAKRAISSEELTQWLNETHALKQVLILDACNSGKMVEALAAGKKELSGSQIRALDRMKDRTGMFVLAGSAANKVSYEASQYGQGLLTYSLLQGIKGLAHPDDERVDVMKLFQYSCDQVPELAKGIGGIQTPMLVGPQKGSFDIGIKNDSVHIKIADPKPVFIRNNFTDDASFDDVLGLTDALENYFRELTVKGAQAEIIFVDVKEYENAWSIKGRYQISGDAVAVQGRLFKGKTAIGKEFKVTGKKNEVPGLAEAIFDKAMEMLR